MPTRVLHVLTIPESLRFIAEQVDYASDQGFEVHVITSAGPYLSEFVRKHPVCAHTAPLTRRIEPARDTLALWRVVRLVRRIRPHVLHAHTPKASLLGLLAAKLCAVPARIFQLRGMPSETASMPSRALLRMADRACCALSHAVVSQSDSLRTLAIELSLCTADKIRVLENGSNGVDASDAFNPERLDPDRSALKEKLGLDANSRVIGFVGRLVRDKGIRELLAAWQELRLAHPDVELLLVGPPEERDSLSPEMMRLLEEDPRIHLEGAVADPAPYYAVMDVLALPTYREGFPNVALEAAAMCVPVVASAVTGCVDAVEDGRTGRLVQPRDARALAEALKQYLEAPDLRDVHGQSARARVLADFRRQPLCEAQVSLYRELIAARCAPLAR